MTLAKLVFEYCALLLLFLFPSFLFSQEISDDNWLKSNDRGNRFEGRYQKNISNPALELVSFWAGFEPYEFGSNQELKVAFRLPDTTHFIIKAEEIRTQEFYWMQNKQSKFSPGWNEFSPWPVDFMLKDLAIRPNNLGIIIKSADQHLPAYVPAFVYHSPDAKEPDFFAFIFRLGISISGGTANIYKGKIPLGRNPDPANLLHTENLGKRFSGSSLPLRLNKSVLTKEDVWFTLILQLDKLNSTEKLIQSMTFYYEPGE